MITLNVMDPCPSPKCFSSTSLKRINYYQYKLLFTINTYVKNFISNTFSREFLWIDITQKRIFSYDDDEAVFNQKTNIHVTCYT